MPASRQPAQTGPTDLPMIETYKGVTGFVVSDIVRIILMTLAPILSLWLSGLW
jgi:TRAP-type C4-dicarboxylate transport system permease large subunit